MKIGIVGAGSWGTALAQVLVDNNNDVIIYGIQPDEIQEINENHTLSRFFGDLKLHADIKGTLNLKDLNACDIILLAVPTAAVESVCHKLNEVLSHKVIIINVAKGFHPVTHKLLSDVITETIKPEYLTEVVSLIGPSHAEEVIKRNITTINAVCANDDVSKIVQDIFSNDYFRVYRNHDVIGSQIGVGIKNIISLASGMLEGLELGDNAKAALITRGLAEMTRYGVKQGGQQETFLGLCGVGDLIVTCTSPHSRNFQAGLSIGKGMTGEEFLNSNSKTVEGVWAAKVIYEESLKQDIEMPITQQVYEIIYNNKDPRQAIKDLMLRDLKRENQ